MQIHPWILIAAAPFLGSFAESLAQRLPLGRSVVAGRSHCERCAVVLGPFQLVPVVSWVVLGGRCGRCRAPIPATHVIAELAAAALALWAVVIVPGWLVWPTAALGWVLLALALMDFYHLVLADILVLPLLLSGIAISFSMSKEMGIASALGVLVGGGGAFAVRELYRLTRGREGLGLGDVKFLAAAGAWVSWQGLPSVLFIASLTALAAWFVLWALRAREHSQLSGSQRIPFGIFLALGLWIVWLHGPIQFGSS